VDGLLRDFENGEKVYVDANIGKEETGLPKRRSVVGILLL
jgi:hypothetical protein